MSTLAASPVILASPALPFATMASLRSVALTTVVSAPASGFTESGTSARSLRTVRTRVPVRSSTVRVSSPPSDTTSTCSMRSRRIVMLPTLRVRRASEPSGEIWKRSLTFEPKKVSVSLPLRPSTSSLPSPGFQMKRSSPPPRSARSSPPLPSTTSLPGPPLSFSPPAPPVSVSLPRSPSMRVGVVFVNLSPDSSMRTVSLPPPACTRIRWKVLRRTLKSADPSLLTSTSSLFGVLLRTRSASWSLARLPLMISVSFLTPTA